LEFDIQMLAACRLTRLEPFGIRIFVPVTLEADIQLKGVGYHSGVSGLGIIMDALHVNLGSNENTRHL